MPHTGKPEPFTALSLLLALWGLVLGPASACSPLLLAFLLRGSLILIVIIILIIVFIALVIVVLIIVLVIETAHLAEWIFIDGFTGIPVHSMGDELLFDGCTDLIVCLNQSLQFLHLLLFHLIILRRDIRGREEVEERVNLLCLDLGLGIRLGALLGLLLHNFDGYVFACFPVDLGALRLLKHTLVISHHQVRLLKHGVGEEGVFAKVEEQLETAWRTILGQQALTRDVGEVLQDFNVLILDQVSSDVTLQHDGQPELGHAGNFSWGISLL
mmetsp:Transcript_24573/g.67010  ORF Transcript_24573/g.67010 Transcript_24573/m.67010 type:complete len:271 (+) Transcript_24573:279-1091(+)